MNDRDFIYWLSGFLENGNITSLSKEQVDTIKDHLALVVKKVTPTYTITTTPAYPTQTMDTTVIC